MEVHSLSARDAALWYARELGWHVFPVRFAPECDEQGNVVKVAKRSATGAGGNRLATTDPDQIYEWWEQPGSSRFGVAVRLDMSGLFAVDIDPRHGGIDLVHWPELEGGVTTLTAETMSDGWHYLFPEADFDNTRIWNRDGVEVMHSGHIVLAPSMCREMGMKTGVIETAERRWEIIEGYPAYRWRTAYPPTRDPRLDELIRNGAKSHIGTKRRRPGRILQASDTSSDGTAWQREDGSFYFAGWESGVTESGDQNDALYKAIGYMHQHGYSEDEIRETLERVVLSEKHYPLSAGPWTERDIELNMNWLRERAPGWNRKDPTEGREQFLEEIRLDPENPDDASLLSWANTVTKTD
jgi:hypothetical protein